MAKGKYKKWQEPNNLLKLEAWARDGISDKQIAHNMGINVATLYTYKNKYPNIDEALKKGKEVSDIEVENSLNKRANGCTITEKKITKEFGEIVSEVITIKELPPDVTAQIFWLKNRKPLEWRDRKNIEMSGEVNNPFEGLTSEELKKLANK